ncbi:hypothetical protein [Leptolyngbya sp. AN02str]|uniref:hypothetical protein n=1 Tax=Leptolyngbya sp. AN02str TaxID=3423363 RepID=UPI003D316714
MMWTGLIHLLVGNLIIGYVEGRLLSKLFGTAKRLSVGVLILANYASTWVGTLLLVGRLSNHPAVTLENLQVWIVVLVIAAFLLTLLIEYPFIWFLLRQRKQALQTALKAAFVIHGISYLLLFGWYGLNSQTSLLTELSLVPAAQLQTSERYTLYFLASDSGQPMRLNLPELKPTAIDQSEFLAIAPELNQTFGPVPKLTETTDWDYYANVFAGGGLTGLNRRTKSSVRFSLETPFIFWSISRAAHLSGDLLVFQLGRHQICLLDPKTKRIALIAKGKELVVHNAILEQPK